MGAAVLVGEGYRTYEAASLPSLQVVNETFIPQELPSSINETAVTNERYAHSLRTIRKVGEIGVRGEMREEDISPEAMLRADFYTAIGEMLKTDSRLRHLLDINPRATYEVKNNKTVLANGKTLEKMVGDGYEASLEASKTDPFMVGQAERDGEDKLNVRRVDRLRSGQMLVVPSADPLEGYKRDGAKSWDVLGYREGMIFFQWYYRQNEHVMVAGSCSVEGNDRDSLRQLLTRHGTEVPDEVSDAQWLRYGIELEVGEINEEEAEAQAKEIRKEFYQLMGLQEERFSVTDFITANQQVMDEIFHGLYKPMAEASFTGEKNECMHELAGALLGQSSDLRSQIRSDLMRVYNMSSFDDEATRTMEFLIRYGTVERLRDLLVRRLSDDPGRELQAFRSQPVPDHLYQPISVESSSVTSLLAGNVAAGAKAGRTYGGCAAGKNMNKEEGDSDGGPQEAFGGKDDDEEEPDGKKKWMRCPSCKGKVFDDPCRKDLKCWHCPAKVVNGRVVMGESGDSKTTAKEKKDQVKGAVEKIGVIPQSEQPVHAQRQAGSLALVGASDES